MGEALIAADANAVVSVRVRGKLQQPYFRLLGPAKWTTRNPLVVPVNADRIMRRRAAEVGAPFRVHIAEGSGVDKNFLIANRGDQGKGIGVAVAGAAVTEWSGVEQSENRTSIKNDDARILKDIHRTGFPFVGERSAATLRTQPPHSDFVQIAIVVIEVALP